MACIYIIEDDPSINNLLKISLERNGHRCICFFDGESALESIQKTVPDVLILDVMLPGIDGFEVKKRLRDDVPVIFLTARGEMQDRIIGLGLGADDYVVKPFDILELSFRVQNLLKRVKPMSNEFSVGQVTIDLYRRVVLVHGKPIDLTPQEYALIETLVINRNVALSRERLLEIAWGSDYLGDTRTVDVHISAIRKKLNWNKVITTVSKIGYRLEVDP